MGERQQGARDEVPIVAQLDAPIEPYDRHEEIWSVVQRVEAHTMVTRHRLAVTYQIAVFAELHGLSGSFVECGTWKGGASGLLALANLRHGATRRNLHLFDSFSDMCLPDEAIDGNLAVQQARDLGGVIGPLDGSLTPMDGFYQSLGGHATVNDVHSLLIDTLNYDSEFLFVHEGWFQETIPVQRESIGPIAVLRLDSDFYRGTRFSLEMLFDQVVEGGFVIIDDYGCYQGCQRAVDDFLAQQNLPHYLNHIDAEGRYLIKR